MGVLPLPFSVVASLQLPSSPAGLLTPPLPLLLSCRPLLNPVPDLLARVWAAPLLALVGHLCSAYLRHREHWTLSKVAPPLYLTDFPPPSFSCPLPLGILPWASCLLTLALPVFDSFSVTWLIMLGRCVCVRVLLRHIHACACTRAWRGRDVMWVMYPVCSRESVGFVWLSL